METVLHTGASNAVLAALLALVVALLARFCRRPALVHVLWLLVLLRLVMPPLWGVRVPWPRKASSDLEKRVSTLPAPRADSPAPPTDVPSVADRTGHPAPDRPPGEPEPAPVLPLPSGERRPAVEDGPPALAALPDGSPIGQPSERPEIGKVSEPAPAAVSWEWNWQPVAAAAWLAGAVWWWAVAFRRLARFHRMLCAARLAPEAVQDQAGRVARLLGLRRCPRVWFVHAPVSPLLLALGPRPRLLVPVALWDLLSAEQQDTLLAHELAHLARRDHWVRRLEMLVLGLYWWYPVAWWARRRLQEAEEECCDARVVSVLPEAALAYASTLLKTVEFLSGGPEVVPMSASGLGPVASLKRRLTMILCNDSRRGLSKLAVLLVLVLAVPLLSLTLGRAEPPQTPPPARPAGPATKPPVDPTAPLRTTGSLPRTETAPERALPPEQGPVDPLLVTRVPRVPNPLPAATERQRQMQAEDLRDEIELLKAQMAVKEAQLQAAQVGVDRWQAEVSRLEREVKRGVVDVQVLAESRNQLLVQQAQVRVKMAELVEPKVRLRQTERRLAALQQDGERAAPADRAQLEMRLQEVEKKLDALLKEVNELRRQLRPRGPDSGRNHEPTPDEFKRSPDAGRQ